MRLGSAVSSKSSWLPLRLRATSGLRRVCDLLSLGRGGVIVAVTAVMLCLVAVTVIPCGVAVPGWRVAGGRSGAELLKRVLGRGARGGAAEEGSGRWVRVRWCTVDGPQVFPFTPSAGTGMEIISWLMEINCTVLISHCNTNE